MLFSDAVSANLKSYLLRTLCTDVAYTILSAMTGSNLSNTTSPKVFFFVIERLVFN